MKPYQTKKLEQFPDCGDIRDEGRKSVVGRLRGPGGDYRASINSKSKRATRRALKRADKAKAFRNLDRDW
jgi:hypothetical protein